MFAFIYPYPDGGLWPPWVWQLIADLGVLAAIASIIAGVIYLWNHGPRLLIKHGPQWMTTLGTYWNRRRVNHPMPGQHLEDEEK